MKKFYLVLIILGIATTVAGFVMQDNFIITAAIGGTAFFLGRVLTATDGDKNRFQVIEMYYLAVQEYLMLPRSNKKKKEALHWYTKTLHGHILRDIDRIGSKPLSISISPLKTIEIMYNEDKYKEQVEN